MSTGADFVVHKVSAAATRPLRQRVLRPHQAASELVYPGDDAPTTAHFMATAPESDVALAVASIYAEAFPPRPESPGWRLRGMAVEESQRGQGLGALLLQRCMAYASEHGGGVIWCNARTTAAGFYLAGGFAVEGAAFELPGIGPHYLMWRAIPA